MQPPFDIAADLDTPVSTWLKLAPLQPRFLLESVESGFQLARYSFLGFGPALELRLDEKGLRVGTERRALPADRPALLATLRETLARTPRLLPEVPDLPLAGGLVGVAASARRSAASSSAPLPGWPSARPSTRSPAASRRSSAAAPKPRKE